MRKLIALIPRPITYLRRRLEAWARQRQGTDPDPVTLKSRRTYIIPTALGIGYGLVLFAMLMASMNYNNSMGIALTFTLAGLGLVAMHWCHQNLTGLIIRGIRIEPTFAGQPAMLELSLDNTSSSERYEIAVACGANIVPTVDLEPGSVTEVCINLPTNKRGLFFVERIGLACFAAGHGCIRLSAVSSTRRPRSGESRRHRITPIPAVRRMTEKAKTTSPV